MKVDLEGKIAIVTGGGHGIGLATTKQFADNGAQVVIVDINADWAASASAEVREHGGKCLGLVGDVADPDKMQAVVDEVINRFDRIDILVNNAGINVGPKSRAPINEFALEDWDRIVRTDMRGVFVTSRAVTRKMIESGGGRIVNIASIAGLVPLRMMCAFVAAKAGVANLTKGMAIELGPHNILVNCVAPGSTLTEGTRNLYYGADAALSENAARLLSHIPLGRPAETHEIAAAVLFLVSPEASYVNGAVIPVDGGWIAGGFARDF